MDFSAVAQLLKALGSASVLLFLPYVAVIALDVLGWRHTMPNPRSISITQLGIIRLATDAVMNTFPAGVAFAETLRPLLLHQRTGMRWTDAVSVTIVSKINIAVMQMLFILTGITMIMIGYENQLSVVRLFSTPTSIFATAAAVVLVAGVLCLPYSGRMFSRLSSLLERLPHCPIRQRVQRFRRSLTEIDGYLLHFRKERSLHLLMSLAYFFLSWAAMAGETWLILTLLGREVTLVQVVIIESLAGIVKIAFFFIPSAIGAQEVTFIMLFAAFGFSDALNLSAAYILLRRGKELFWALTGLTTFWHLGINPFKPAMKKG